MIEMKVGNYYFSENAGLLKCIAERDGEFIVKNGNYYYRVNSQGKALPSNGFTSGDGFNLESFSKNLNTLFEPIKNSD